jgi:hypothetical protein
MWASVSDTHFFRFVNLHHYLNYSYRYSHCSENYSELLFRNFSLPDVDDEREYKEWAMDGANWVGALNIRYSVINVIVETQRHA